MNRIFVLSLVFFARFGSLIAADASEQFVDDSGRVAVVHKPFTRIISLYGAHTENLFSLGLEQEIVGVCPNETYPPAALKKPVFSYRDDLERFLAAKPDLVLIRPMIYRGYRALVAGLEAAGIAVVSLQPRSVETMFEYWERLGVLVGKKERALHMIETFKTGLAAIQKTWAGIPESSRPRVYFESIHSKMKTFAPRSLTIFALESAGGINIASDAKAVRGTNIAAYGKERILSRAHDIDVYLAQKGAMNPITAERIQRESGFMAIKAVRNGRVYLVNERLVSRPTMRLLQGMRRIQALLYSEFPMTESRLKGKSFAPAKFVNAFLSHNSKQRSMHVHAFIDREFRP